MADGEPGDCAIGHGWFRIIADGNRIRLVATAAAPIRGRRQPARLPGGPHARRAAARSRAAWLAEPTDR